MYIVNTSLGTSFIFMGKNQTLGPIDFRGWLSANLENLGSF